MNKRIISTIIAMVMIVAIISTIPTQAESTIKIGDYVVMGKYYDERILWRCVDIDEFGPLMLADKILSIKPFDAKGKHIYMDGTAQPNDHYYREDYGSNLWETSNIRLWLNSTDIAGNVVWPGGCPPENDKVWGGYNDYALEKGFIADGNFTTIERNAIASVTQKSLLNGIDVTFLKVDGTTNHILNTSISTVVQNFHTAYYQNVCDKMFLLDVSQVNKVYQNLGDYYIGKPSQKAVDNSEYVNKTLSTDKDIAYWLRTPSTGANLPFSVRNVNSDGSVDKFFAYNGSIGVRPAFYINLSTGIIKAGNGSVDNPYSEEGQISVVLNGTKIIFDQPPFIENDRTLTPIRAIFEAMSADVEWGGASQTVTVVKGDINIKFQIDNKLAYRNGQEILLDVTPKILGDRTFLPIRFIADCMGADVKWDETTQTVNITTK